MKNRSPVAVFFLSLITFGIYAVVWEVKTKGEMKSLGADIPTAWLLIVPFVSIYWLWKYSQGVEKVTNGKLSTPLAFVMLWLLGIIGMAIVQSEFNSLNAEPLSAVPSPAGTPASPVQPLPDNSFGGPVMPTVSVAPNAPVVSESPAAAVPAPPLDVVDPPVPAVAELPETPVVPPAPEVITPNNPVVSSEQPPTTPPPSPIS